MGTGGTVWNPKKSETPKKEKLKQKLLRNPESIPVVVEGDPSWVSVLEMYLCIVYIVPVYSA